MLDAETIEFLESGCALIVGTVGEDGAPHAARAWGLDVLGDDALRVRLLVDAADDTTLDRLDRGGAIAVTATDVATFRSVQLKGRAAAVEPAVDDDRQRARRYADAFYADVQAEDATPLALLERLFPEDVVVCLADIDELFDQTPGPAAGAALDPDSAAPVGPRVVGGDA